MKVFVTSNQQFGRPSAIKSYKRPFDSVEEMDMQMIEAWNSVVNKEDIVYVLGNFAWDPETADLTMSQLNGDIMVLRGEHDNAVSEINMATSSRFHMLDNGIQEHSDQNLVMSYWPLADWPGKSKGSYSIIGIPVKKYKTNHKTKIINCSCDLWEFKPIEVIKIIELFNDITI
jgi:calcineurin-like phosphoesterase family protein